MLRLAIVLALSLGGLFTLMCMALWYERREALPKADPERVLADRFAKGEIDEQEYARRLGILRYGPPIELPD
ncbi:MAG TPA: SHOCT domain-containing protein [Acidimicrobiales bacterium]|nr:SHOCT domain-containing protein [Acidimicrobiales bacterium]